MPYNVFKEVSREVQEMRKNYKMRAHVWRRVFLTQRKTKKKLRYQLYHPNPLELGLVANSLRCAKYYKVNRPFS
jgi:hypothetical protein